MNQIGEADVLGNLGLFADIQAVSMERSSSDVSVASECLDCSDTDAEDLTKYCRPPPIGTQGQNPYNVEWNDLFSSSKYLDNLRNSAIRGRLKHCHFRSICWKVFLECLPEEKSQWVHKTNLLRAQYEEMLQEFQRDPRIEDLNVDLSLNHPLSHYEESLWNQHFEDKKLKRTIEQDVCRTYPEVQFFHTEEVQKMMVNILFCHAKKFPQISYRQGMHELLAPIIYILNSDHEAYAEVARKNEFIHQFDPDTSCILSILLDSTYIEHDAFSLLCQLMDEVDRYYIMSDRIHMKKRINFNLEPFYHRPATRPVNALGVKLTKIHEQVLRTHDSELYDHLNGMEIPPQMYGVRWLRLLFGREFVMQDLVLLWDAIFAYSLCSDLVDYIFTSMLIYIRDSLLNSNYSSCMTILMKYPVIVNVQYILELALHMKKPNMYSKPIKYSVQGTNFTSLAEHLFEASQRNSSSHSIKNLFEKKKKKIDTSRPTSLAILRDVPNDPSKNSQNFISQSNTATSKAPPIVASTSNQLPSDVHNDDNLHLDVAKTLMQEISHSTKKSKRILPPTELPDWDSEGHASTSQASGKVDKFIQEQTKLIEYCSAMMTVHLKELESSIKDDEIQKDDMLLAVAGLKKVRDILNGTVSFSPDDEDMSVVFESSNSDQRQSQGLDNNKNEEFVIIQNDIHDNTDSSSPSKLNYRRGVSAKSNYSDCELKNDSKSKEGLVSRLTNWF